MSAVLSLTDFLMQRIAEDEAVAQAAVDDDGGETGGMEDSFDQLTGRAKWCGVEVIPKYGDDLARLIVRTAVPARVLAECETKRRIVELHDPVDDKPDGWCNRCDGDGWPCGTMAALALPYADHPAFRAEWRP